MQEYLLASIVCVWTWTQDTRHRNCIAHVVWGIIGNKAVQPMTPGDGTKVFGVADIEHVQNYLWSCPHVTVVQPFSGTQLVLLFKGICVSYCLVLTILLQFNIYINGLS